MSLRLMAVSSAGLVFLSAVALVNAADPAGPKLDLKVVPLWTDKAPGAVGDEDRDRPTLTVHLPEPSRATGTAIVVCPGGGYVVHAIDHEGQQVARWLNSIGVAAFVLKYRLKPRYQVADALADGKRAVRYVRAHAEEYRISPQRVGMLGFSAGGHLAACNGIDFDAGDPKATDPVERQSNRPDFTMLIYGAATVLGDPGNKDAVGKEFSAQSPPTFLFSTDEDKGTDRILDCYRALRKVGVSAELHVFGRYGPHGTGLAPGDPAVGAWPELAHAWLRKSGLLTTAERLQVSGLITIDGQPLHRGWITFIPVESPNKPVACCYIPHNQKGKFTITAANGPCAGPHRVEIRLVATDFLTVPSMADALLFTRASKEAKEELRSDVKVGENTANYEIRTK